MASELVPMGVAQEVEACIRFFDNLAMSTKRQTIDDNYYSWKVAPLIVNISMKKALS